MEQKRSSLIKLTFEELEMVAVQTFQQIINEEITRWREKNNVATHALQSARGFFEVFAC